MGYGVSVPMVVDLPYAGSADWPKALCCGPKAREFVPYPVSA